MLIFRKRFLGIALLIFCTFLIAYDSMFHFLRDRISEKIKRNSPVVHWSIYHNSSYVYMGSSFRYEKDLNRIKGLVLPRSALLSDLATSYYAAAYLPLYIRNTHRHHGLHKITGLEDFLQNGHLCFIKDPYRKEAVVSYLKRDRYLAKTNNWPMLEYIIINKDKKNIQLRRDCLSLGSRRIIENISFVADILYEGEYLNLYKLKDME